MGARAGDARRAKEVGAPRRRVEDRTLLHGQGHETVWAQVVADALGVAFDDVSVVHGDTDVGPPGIGSFGGRSAMLAGSALVQAAQRVQAKAVRIASHLLETDPDDLVYQGG